MLSGILASPVTQMVSVAINGLSSRPTRRGVTILSLARRFPSLSAPTPQKSEQNGDNWCISPTNYPPSAPLSNWSFLYFTIFAVFPFPFVYLSPLFRLGQWARTAHYSPAALARDPPLNLGWNSSELPDNKARFLGWLIGVRITFCFFVDTGRCRIDLLKPGGGMNWLFKRRDKINLCGINIRGDVYRGRGSH